MKQEPMVDNADDLKPETSLLGENWKIFKRNKFALLNMYLLLLLVVVAVLGRFLTKVNVVFDASMVRLSEKLLPPLTWFNSDIVPVSEAPAFGIYILGTDDLGRDVFARMLEGTFVSLTVGFVAVGKDNEITKIVSSGYKEVIDKLQEIVEESQTIGEIRRDLKPDDTAYWLFCSTYGLLMLAKSDFKKSKIKKIAMDTIDILI